MTTALQVAVRWGMALNAFAVVLTPAAVVLIIIVETLVRRWGKK